MLAKRFFAKQTDYIPLSFPDDPPPRALHDFPPFGDEELLRMLTITSNSSAPGSSSIGWELLKKGWGVVGTILTQVFDACLALGHHPACWHEAKVVVIPKPDKPDYAVPKAHRPISLLKTMSKLLEKAVAKQIQHDIVAYELVPTNQFGGHSHSSCLDTAMTLVHDVQTAHAADLKVGMLLFDVRGFFDNVNHGCMCAILQTLGFLEKLVEWVHAFLHDRKV